MKSQPPLEHLKHDWIFTCQSRLGCSFVSEADFDLSPPSYCLAVLLGDKWLRSFPWERNRYVFLIS